MKIQVKSWDQRVTWNLPKQIGKLHKQLEQLNGELRQEKEIKVITAKLDSLLEIEHEANEI